MGGQGVTSIQTTEQSSFRSQRGGICLYLSKNQGESVHNFPLCIEFDKLTSYILFSNYDFKQKELLPPFPFYGHCKHFLPSQKDCPTSKLNG